MQQVSAAFLAEIRKSHVVYSYVDLVAPNGQQMRLIATGGSVSVDRTADIRRVATVQCINPQGLTASDFTALNITPFGSVVRPYRGVKYTSGALGGSTEVVPLGEFWLTKSTFTDTGGEPIISLEMSDQSYRIQRDKFTDTYTIPEGYNIVQGVKDIVDRSIAGVNYDAFGSSATLSAPMVFGSDDDPWQAANTLAAAAGCEVFFDARGWCVIAPPLDVDHLPAPAFTFIEGAGCTMTELDVVLSDEPGNNGVIMIGESVGEDSPPVRAVVWDEEPSSLTYHKGPYGEVPLVVTDTTVTTQSQAYANAYAMLNQILGFPSKLNLISTVNPALDANDVVAVKRQRLGVDASYAVDSVTIPLGVGDTSAVALRQKRVS